jgi:hypothetical protein
MVRNKWKICFQRIYRRKPTNCNVEWISRVTSACCERFRAASRLWCVPVRWIRGLSRTACKSNLPRVDAVIMTQPAARVEYTGRSSFERAAGRAILRKQIDPRREATRQAWIKAKVIIGMLQGSMALEGQGLGEKTLRAMTKQTVRDLLARR